MSPPNWYKIIDATWPAAHYHSVDGWIIREGQGGGKRVSAASGAGAISVAESTQQKLLQDRLFMIGDVDEALDHQLQDQGYRIIDPVVIYAKALEPPRPKTAKGENPTKNSVRIWAEGGIGPDRLAVMDRAIGPKTVIQSDHGCAFVCCHDGIAMIHALEVAQTARSQGIGTTLVKQAEAWAPARKIAALTVETNTASRGLFEKLGYCLVGRYHYRIKN